MTIALAIAIASCLPHIWKAYKYIRKSAKDEGVQEQMTIGQARALHEAVEELKRKLERGEDITRREIDELVKSVSLNNDLANQRFHDFYREFSLFRADVSRYMRNGGAH